MPVSVLLAYGDCNGSLGASASSYNGKTQHINAFQLCLKIKKERPLFTSRLGQRVISFVSSRKTVRSEGILPSYTFMQKVTKWQIAEYWITATNFLFANSLQRAWENEKVEHFLKLTRRVVCSKIMFTGQLGWWIVAIQGRWKKWSSILTHCWRLLLTSTRAAAMSSLEHPRSFSTFNCFLRSSSEGSSIIIVNLTWNKKTYLIIVCYSLHILPFSIFKKFPF